MKTNIKGLVCAIVMAMLATSVKAQNLYLTVQSGRYNFDIVQLNTNGQGPGYQTSSLTTSIFPSSAVFDSAGDLFVATEFSIVELTNDNGTLSTNLTLFSPTFSYGLAFDQAGDLFASGTNIIEFVNDGGTLDTNPTVVATGPLTPWAMVFDRVGNLYVAYLGSGMMTNGYVAEFATNGTETILSTNLANPHSLAFDGAGNLYVALYPGLNFPPGGPAILEIATNGLQSVYFGTPKGAVYPSFAGLAFDNTGVLYAIEDPTPSPMDEYIVKFKTPGNPTIFSYPFDITNGVGEGKTIGAMAFEPVPLLRSAVTNGIFQLTVTTPSPYYETIVQSSSDLVNWCNVCTNLAPFTFTDSLTKTASFYRAVLDTNSY